MPPMNVPSNTASETADTPTTSCKTWNQTISYINAAHPDPMKRSSIGGRKRAEGEAPEGKAVVEFIRLLLRNLLTVNSAGGLSRKRETARSIPRADSRNRDGRANSKLHCARQVLGGHTG